MESHLNEINQSSNSTQFWVLDRENIQEAGQKTAISS